MWNNPYRRNLILIYIKSFLGGLVFYLPILAIYLEDKLYSILNVTIILSVRALAIVILEVPTGVISDTFGRKISLILSNIIGIIYIFLLIFSSSMIEFSLAMVVGALSFTLTSGTDTAILFESVEKIEDNKPQFKTVTAIHSSLWPIGASISSIIGSYAATHSMTFPFYMTMVATLLGLLVLLFIRDINEEDEEKEESKVMQSIRLISRNTQLKIIFGVGFVSYAIGEVVHSLKPVYFEFKGIDLELFGMLFFLTFGFSFIGSLLSSPLSTRFGDKRVLIISSFIPFFFQVFSLLSTGFLSGILLTVGSLSWGVRWPILSHLTNLEIVSGNRATVLSMSTMANYLGFVMISPIFGYIADLYDISTLVLIDAIVSVFLAFIYFKLRG